jgi:senataxin
MLAVGDPKQLPASVTSRRAAEFGLDKSLLDRLMFECGKDHMMLDVQYRMSPAISAFPSTTFYDSKLRNGQNVSSPSYKGEISIIGPQPYTFINVNGSGESRASSGSYYNAAEANAVLRLVQIIQDASRDVRNWASIDKIRIITFYSGQVRAIKDLLRSRGLTNVTCATVDSSQGSEADIVIVSFVRSNGNSSNSEGQHNVGFLNDDRRINVALTRAKYKLFCLGDANTLLNAGAHTITDLVNNAKSRNLLFDQDILK